METKRLGITTEARDYNYVFGERLKALRQANGLTIKDFAEKAGISKSSVGYYENQNRVPDIVTVGKMADILNVSTDYLIGRASLHSDVQLGKKISKDLSDIKRYAMWIKKCLTIWKS